MEALAQWTPIDISDYDIFVEADLYRVDQRSSSGYLLGIRWLFHKAGGRNGIGDIVLRMVRITSLSDIP